MLEKSVKKLFKEQADYYSIKESTAKSSPLVRLFLKWVKKKSANGRSASGGKKIKVGEFGGAAGQLLAEIGKYSSDKFELFNIEIVDHYRRHQISPKIKFIKGSILEAPFKNEYFDGLIVRDVLHHLVGNNLAETNNNQKKALRELKRLIKPDGIILIEELVTSSKLSSRIIYALSKFSTKLGFKIVVSFQTPKDLEKNIADVFNDFQIEIKKIPWNRELKSRLIHLGAKTWKIVIAIRP